MRYDQWLQLRIGLLACYQGRPASLHSERISPDYISIWLIHRGSVEVSTGTHRLCACAGQGMIVGPGPRGQEFSRDIDFHSFSFFANWPDGKSLLGSGLPCFFDLSGRSLIQRLDRMNTLFESFSPQHGFFSFQESVSLKQYLLIQQEFQGILLELLPILERNGIQVTERKELDARVIRAIDYMEHPPNPSEPVTLAALAKSCGVSPSHLDRLFRNELGNSPMAWYQNHRFLRARYLLHLGEMPLKQVGYELGFKSIAHFSSWYKKQAGHPPSKEPGSICI
ncbi:MAG: AraC family transcriptional regulator [Kiritimatiellae bacterium]|jgi:AraC-like DNA-binding protein|nr:AraC family transcriptional regulator [Kiritimatiellia bacterium]